MAPGHNSWRSALISPRGGRRFGNNAGDTVLLFGAASFIMGLCIGCLIMIAVHLIVSSHIALPVPRLVASAPSTRQLLSVVWEAKNV
jgi:hypothetical protein